MARLSARLLKKILARTLATPRETPGETHREILDSTPGETLRNIASHTLGKTPGKTLNEIPDGSLGKTLVKTDWNCRYWRGSLESRPESYLVSPRVSVEVSLCVFSKVSHEETFWGPVKSLVVLSCRKYLTRSPAKVMLRDSPKVC